MVALQVAVMVCAVSAPESAVLYEFTAPWCNPCRSMEPTVAQLKAAGYPVRAVNVDRERDLARQYHVQSIPCFVLVKEGREIDRIVGPTTAGELQGMFAKIPPDFQGGDNVRAQSPDEPLRRIAANSPGHQRLLGASAPPAQTIPVADARPDGANPFRHVSATEDFPSARGSEGDDLLKYAVRLTIEDRDGFSHGSGTLIDARGDQALVLTCGHIFRDSQGKGTITVDLCGPGLPKKLQGHVVGYDLKRDVGLVSVRPGRPVDVAKVAPQGFRMSEGDSVVTIGCNNGGEATIERSRVIAVNKFVGPENVQVAGQPVQGRSGGGLFTPDGMLVGVCNAADPQDNAGLYAAAAAVHEELDAAKLSSIYRRVGDSAPLVARGQTEAISSEPTSSPRAADLRAMSQPIPSVGERTTLADLRAHAQDAEVICIIRPRGQADAKSEVIVLDRASAEFLEKLASERQSQTARRYTSLEVPRR